MPIELCPENIKGRDQFAIPRSDMEGNIVLDLKETG
jgi:hypothetical protein